MSPLDGTFLHVEDGITHMHIGSCAIFEGPAPALRRDHLRYRAASCRSCPAIARRCASSPATWGGRCGSTIRTSTSTTTCAARRCPRRAATRAAHLDGAADVPAARPPPTAVGDVDGRGPRRRPWALISKTHHCMVDGVSGTDLMALLLDAGRKPSPPLDELWQPAPEPSDARAGSPTRSATPSPARTRWPVGCGPRSAARGAWPPAPWSRRGALASIGSGSPRRRAVDRGHHRPPPALGLGPRRPWPRSRPSANTSGARSTTSCSPPSPRASATS